MNAPALGLFDYDCEGSYNDREAWCTDREMILSDLTDAGLGGFAEWLDSDRDGTWYPNCPVVEDETDEVTDVVEEKDPEEVTEAPNEEETPVEEVEEPVEEVEIPDVDFTEEETTDDTFIDIETEPEESAPIEAPIEEEEPCVAEFAEEECVYTECSVAERAFGNNNPDCWRETCQNECANSCLLWYLGDYNAETGDWNWDTQQCLEDVGQEAVMNAETVVAAAEQFYYSFENTFATIANQTCQGECESIDTHVIGQQAA
jgi:hypothetical protein